MKCPLILHKLNNSFKHKPSRAPLQVKPILGMWEAFTKIFCNGKCVLYVLTRGQPGVLFLFQCVPLKLKQSLRRTPGKKVSLQLFRNTVCV